MDSLHTHQPLSEAPNECGCCQTQVSCRCLCGCFLSLLVVNSSLNLAPRKRFDVRVISGSLSLLSHLFVYGPRSRKIGGWLSLHLRCIVVKATQILQSSLVAKLVLILSGRQKNVHLLSTRFSWLCWGWCDNNNIS